ncbi:hypothetical protein [Comamonas composti]|uniref:hypothetical protein n=1 Tax=Comamonas composti TaxID=408558 RepID=UPI0003FC335D|nr:hypothetical protein [Comamonas composti]
MSLGAWLLWFALNSAFFYWVLCRGGAAWLEGWRAGLALDTWYASLWSAEQIRLYVLLQWIVHTIWFVLGLVQPEWRWG